MRNSWLFPGRVKVDNPHDGQYGFRLPFKEIIISGHMSQTETIVPGVRIPRYTVLETEMNEQQQKIGQL